MKKSIANQIAKLWNENHTGYSATSKTKAVVETGPLDWQVKIFPTEENYGTTFNYVTELAAIEEAFRVGTYLRVQDEKIIAVIY